MTYLFLYLFAGFIGSIMFILPDQDGSYIPGITIRDIIIACLLSFGGIFTLILACIYFVINSEKDWLDKEVTKRRENGRHK